MTLVLLLVRLIVSTRRSVAAWALYLLLVLVIYSSDPGPAGPAYASTVGLLLPVTVWLGVVGAPRESGTTCLLAAAAGGPARLHALATAATVVVAAPLVVVAVVAGPVASSHPYGVRVLALAFLAHLTAVLVGAGVAAVTGRAVLRDTALSLLAAVAVCVLLVIVPRMSPLGPTLRTLGRATLDSSTASVRAGSIVACLAGAAVWCLAGAAAGGWATTRTRGYGTAAVDVRQ